MDNNTQSNTNNVHNEQSILELLYELYEGVKYDLCNFIDNLTSIFVNNSNGNLM